MELKLPQNVVISERRTTITNAITTSIPTIGFPRSFMTSESAISKKILFLWQTNDQMESWLFCVELSDVSRRTQKEG